MRLPAVRALSAQDFWRSPLRGPWLASVLSSALLPLIAICAITGFVSHWAYQPHRAATPSSAARRRATASTSTGSIGPTSPVWLYAATQGLHVITGIAAIPILLAKLWTVIPKLFENPPVLSPRTPSSG